MAALDFKKLSVTFYDNTVSKKYSFNETFKKGKPSTERAFSLPALSPQTLPSTGSVHREEAVRHL